MIEREREKEGECPARWEEHELIPLRVRKSRLQSDGWHQGVAVLARPKRRSSELIKERCVMKINLSITIAYKAVLLTTTIPFKKGRN